MVKQIRNKYCFPYIKEEGTITKPMPTVKVVKPGGAWYSGLKPHERLFMHQTLSSARRYAYFKPFSGLVPRDELDFKLVSVYDHSNDTFADPVDPLLQPETVGIHTWRRLRNSKDMPPQRDAKEPEFSFFSLIKGGMTMERYNLCYPVVIGGISNRDHPSHIKLMNSSHHSPQTNAGYSRQDRGGTMFQY